MVSQCTLQCKVVKNLALDGARRPRAAGHFGTNLPVHSLVQRFWFDTKTGLLRRNDYTPVAAAADARAANVVFEHQVANRVPYTSKRRVKLTPAQYGWVLPQPDFITIDVESWDLR